MVPSEGPQTAGRSSPQVRRFDLDHVGAIIGQESGRSKGPDTYPAPRSNTRMPLKIGSPRAPPTISIFVAGRPSFLGLPNQGQAIGRALGQDDYGPARCRFLCPFGYCKATPRIPRGQSRLFPRVCRSDHARASDQGVAGIIHAAMLHVEPAEPALIAGEVDQPIGPGIGSSASR